MQSTQFNIAEPKYTGYEVEVLKPQHSEAVVVPINQVEESIPAATLQGILQGIAGRIQSLEQRNALKAAEFEKAKQVIETLQANLKAADETINRGGRAFLILESEHREAVSKIDKQGQEILKHQEQLLEYQESIRQLTMKVTQFEGRAVCQSIAKQLLVLNELQTESSVLPLKERELLNHYIQELEQQHHALSTDQSNLKQIIQEARACFDQAESALNRWELLISSHLKNETQEVYNKIQGYLDTLRILKEMVLEENPQDHHQLILSVTELAEIDDYLIDFENRQIKLQKILETEQIPLSHLKKTRQILNKGLNLLPRLVRKCDWLLALHVMDNNRVAQEFIKIGKSKGRKLKACKRALEEKPLKRARASLEDIKMATEALLQQFEEKLNAVTTLLNLSIFTLEQTRRLKELLFDLKILLPKIDENILSVQRKIRASFFFKATSTF